jgi:predicted hydrocarbon binding protein
MIREEAMARHNTPTAGIDLPLPALAAIRRELTAALGPDAAARTLQAAGHAAGDAFHDLLAGDDAPLAGLGEAEFWRRLADLFAERGWGRLQHEDVHPGVGALDSADWAEADAAGAARRPSCHFTTGLLANLLGRIADESVSVLEVECRARGDLRCRFLFGSPAALDAVYGSVAEGVSADRALEELR